MAKVVRKIKNIPLRIILITQKFRFLRFLRKAAIGKLIQYHIAAHEDAEDILKHFPYKRGADRSKTIKEFTQELKASENKEYFILAKIRGNIVGKGAITLYAKQDNPNYWVFSSFFVAHEYRGLGIGEGVLRAALKKAIDSGATEIMLSVFDHLKPAINLYQKVGFQHVSSHRRDDEKQSLIHVYIYIKSR